MARQPGPDPRKPLGDSVTLIETRGSGGYCITHPSNGNVHETGGGWSRVSGSLSTIAHISPDERSALFWTSANHSTKCPSEENRLDVPSRISRVIVQGISFVVNMARSKRSRRSLNNMAGNFCLNGNGVGYYRRPGKDSGSLSATFGHAGTDYFYVFSTSTEFEPERGYNPFSVYVQLEHKGDVRAVLMH